MVVVAAWHDDEADPPVTYHEIRPILALQSTIVTRAFRPYRPNDYDYPEILEQADKNGWQISATSIDMSVIVHNDDSELMEADDAYDYSNTAWLTEVCPWEQSEDEARLADLIELVKALAVRKLLTHKAEKEKESTPEPIKSP
jgi:hypothetical protein